jgi:arsenate reductase (glutaredoxin)
MSLKFYGYKKCGTCRKAEKALESKGLAYEFIDITVNPPSLKYLKAMVDQSGKGLDKFYNTSGLKYKEQNIKDLRKTLTEAEQLKMLSAEGYLLKRPLVSDGQKTTVGYQSEEFLETWK